MYIMRNCVSLDATQKEENRACLFSAPPVILGKYEDLFTIVLFTHFCHTLIHFILNLYRFE
uniref:Uncharacterized protein n=1 Tax=Anguilla anguilla TaxID=7936 RepID=A0A0E9PMU8_ANGAN